MFCKKETKRVIEGLWNYLDTGTNVDAGCQVKNPVSSYTCDEMARQEWESFFQDYSHALGLSSELPEAGSFLTNSDLGKPILMTRDEQGKFRAFLNVCRHRGAILEEKERGRRRLFSCPFHGWGYSSAGGLISVPKEDQFGDIDKSCNGLVELPAEEKHGILWVHPDPNGSFDLEAQLGDLAAEFDSWGFEKYIFQGNTTFEHQMNWKLAIDTFGETYHFNTLHRDTLAKDFHGNCQMYDRFERNHRMMLCLKNIDNLRGQNAEECNVLHACLPVYYIWPNVQLIMGLNGPTLVRVYPEHANPNKSFSRISFFLAPEISTELQSNRGSGESIEDIQARMRGFADVIQKEDYAVAETSHFGALSGAFDHVVFGRNEPALHHYHNTYRSVLNLPPLEAVS